MFDQTFLAPERQHVPSVRFLASVLIECAVVALLILLSVVVSPHLPLRQLRSLLIVPRAPLAAERVAAHVHDTMVSHPGPRRFALDLRVMPLQPASTTSRAEPTPDLTPSILGPASDGANSAGDVLFGSGEAVATQPPPPAKEVKQKGPVPIGGSVAEANLVNKVLPVYPPLARTTHVQGTVVFHAVIGKDGRIDNLEVVSGHPLLIRAAQQAVLQWRYRPTLLNGVPVEVATEITVRFTLGGI